MIIFVLTNGVRRIDDSYKQLNYILHFDIDNSPHSCYIKLLDIARDLHDDILILEDDLELCENFLQHVKEEVKKYSSYIINFFWQPMRDIKHTTIETKGFCYTQCVYYPKGMIDKFFKDLKEPNFSYAKNICQALEKNNIPFVNIRPHYLQHIGDKSLIYPNMCVRRSKQFIGGKDNETSTK